MTAKTGGWNVLGSISHAVDLLLSRLSPSDFRIVYRPGRPVQVRGRIARAKMPGIVRFFSEELNLPGPVTVLGNGGKAAGKPPKPLRIRFSGDIPPGERQRVRNFLMVQLG